MRRYIIRFRDQAVHFPFYYRERLRVETKIMQTQMFTFNMRLHRLKCQMYIILMSIYLCIYSL